MKFFNAILPENSAHEMFVLKLFYNVNDVLTELLLDGVLISRTMYIVFILL